MAFILRGIADAEYGINDTIYRLEYLKNELNVETNAFKWNEGSTYNWNEAAARLSDGVFDAIEDFGVGGVGNWPAWLMFNLGEWIANDWGNTQRWLSDLTDLSIRLGDVASNTFDCLATIETLVASNVICAMQKGWIIIRDDEPSAILAELHYYIAKHHAQYKWVMEELTEMRWKLQSVSQAEPKPQSPAIVSKNDRIIADCHNMINHAMQPCSWQAKVIRVTALYKYLWKVSDFLRSFPNLRTTVLVKLREFAECGDAKKFDQTDGVPSYVELCDRTLAACSGTHVLVPKGYRQAVFSCLEANKSILSPKLPVKKVTRIRIAAHLDQLEEHMVAFAPTLSELTLNCRRLRSGTLLCAKPIVLPNHVVPSVTHEVVVILANSSMPSNMSLSMQPSSTNADVAPNHGGDTQTDPRPLIVYDDDFLDIPYPSPAAAVALSRSPSPHPDDFEEIIYNSDSDGDVFDDYDSENGWEQVHAYHRDASLGLLG